MFVWSILVSWIEDATEGGPGEALDAVERRGKVESPMILAVIGIGVVLLS